MYGQNCDDIIVLKDMPIHKTRRFGTTMYKAMQYKK